MKARLHPLGNGSYSVILDGKLLVERSRDPECDAARALAAKGITGKLTLCDGKTGIPRTIIDIERAAKLRTVETGNAPRFRSVTCAEGSHSLETKSEGGEIALVLRRLLRCAAHRGMSGPVPRLSGPSVHREEWTPSLTSQERVERDLDGWLARRLIQSH
jgi:hypothetical protein